MSLVTYNGITLPYSNTTSFSQDVVYDDQGNTDWICTKFDIQVQCIINDAYLATISSDFDGLTGNAADIMKAIRVQLLQPRRTLSFKCNGTELIPDATAGPGTVDVWNGPKPQKCSIVQVTTNTFVLSYHIVAHYWENYTDAETDTLARENQAGNPCLYNRWSETVDIDNCMMSKRTREGKFMIRSDNDLGITADQLRTQMAVVGVPEGFLRESAHYTVSPDGLAIKYRVVDKEFFKVPPPVAYHATGTYTETTTGLGGCIVYGEATVQLKGAKYTRQSDLITTAMALCATKLYINGAALADQNLSNPFRSRRFSQLVYGEVKVNLYENIVACTLKSMLQARKGRINGIAGFVGVSTFTPFSDTANATGAASLTQGPLYDDRGTASLLLIAASYYDPSLQGATGLVPGDPTFSNSITTGSGRGEPNVQMRNGLEPGTAGVNEESN